MSHLLEMQGKIVAHEDACEILGVSRVTLYKWLKGNNPPPHIKIGPKNGVTLFDRDDLLAWQREHKPHTVRS